MIMNHTCRVSGPQTVQQQQQQQWSSSNDLVTVCNREQTYGETHCDPRLQNYSYSAAAAAAAAVVVAAQLT
jgi:hypothetical protein